MDWHYDPEKPTLVSMGMRKLDDEGWDGNERRRNSRTPKNQSWKFKEVKVPAYFSNDSKLNKDGFYPAGV